MIDWDDLHTFLAIARHGSLSAAARALSVRQSTMGRRLEALERRSGATLLQKTSAGYVLTAAGEAILGNAERVEAEMIAVDRRITGRDVRLEGTIRLTSVETLAVEVLMPMLAGFRLRYPGIAVELLADPRPLSLVKREADVALRFGRPDQAEIVARKVAQLGTGIYASPGYLATRGMPHAPGEGHAIIVTLPDLLGRPDMQGLRGLVPEAEVALASNSRFAHRAAAQAGLGIASLARYLGDAAPGLVRLPVPVPPPHDLWLAVHGDIRHMPRIRALTGFLATELRGAASLLLGRGEAAGSDPESAGQAKPAPP